METDIEKPFCEITTKVKITEYRVRSLLCSALEGGSNHWYYIKGFKFPQDITYQDFREGQRFTTNEEYWHPVQLIPFQEGCGVIFGTIQDNGKQQFILDRKAMERGMQLMIEKYPKHFLDFMEENDDADTGDCFLQLSLFGDVIFC